MARAIRIHEHGGPEVLRFEEVEVGAPGPGEARVRQTAVGVDFIDTYHRSGLYPSESLPITLGMEAAGVVEEVGEGVAVVQPGDRVAYVQGPGAYAEARCLPAERLVKLPDAIGDEAAAAMMLKGMTVEYLVRRTFPVRRGTRVLLHAAAGGVGLIAAQWLAHLGAEVIGTAGTDEKARLASAHGCRHVVVYTRENFVDRVRELTGGRGVDVVYDAVGKSTFQGSLDCLRPRGTLVSFGNASGAPEPMSPLLLSQKGSLYLTRPKLFDYVATRQELLESAEALFEVVATGAVKIEVRQRLPLADAAEAHRALEGRRTVGSTVLLP